MPLDHVPNQTSSRGPESRTRTLLLPRQAAFQQALTPKLAVGAGFEPAHLLINNQTPYQLGHPTTSSIAIKNPIAQIKWLEAESNRRRPTYEIGALPSELSSRDENSA